METKKCRPQRCDECHSNRLIPIINGRPEGQLLILELQDKIALRGCFEISEGSPIWACVDCKKWVNDRNYCFASSNDDLQHEYNASIKRAFGEYQPVGKAEIRKLKGLSLLRTFSRRLLITDEAFRIERSNDSFRINASGEAVTNALFSDDRFCQISEYLSGDERSFLVRCNKVEVAVVAAQLKPDQIRVNKK